MNSDNGEHPKTTEHNKTASTRVRASVDWSDAFLKSLEETGVIVAAAEAAKISRSAVWERRQKDTDFRQRFESALIAGALLLEAEAVRRARDGVCRMKFNPKTGEPYTDPATGKPYIEHEYSDAILLAMLKRHFPEYRDKAPEVNVSQNVNAITALPPEQLRALQERRRIALSQ